jgi:hypothetical protein
MRTRPLEERDLPILEAIYDKLDYSFDDGFPKFLSSEFEAVEVVVDDKDLPIMVCGAKKAVEMVMICDPYPHVTVRLRGIALLHETMRNMLHSLGYKEATSFVPPQIVNTHGRAMQKRFGWVPAWKGYRVI